jgi:hypothetical protein
MVGMTIGILLSIVVPVLLVGAALLQTRGASGIDLSISNDNLVVKVTGKDALFALSHGMTIPLSALQGIAVAARRKVPATGLRLPGTRSWRPAGWLVW